MTDGMFVVKRNPELIERAKLDKIKTEIKRASIKMDYETAQVALAIIDKYTAESENDDNGYARHR